MTQESPQFVQRAGGAASGSPISIDHFVALNDELAAIVRAGMPMERSLRDVARDIPGSLGNTMHALATRLSRGETLPGALAAERDRFPTVYRAVVEAGLKAGRLSAAIEGLATYARNYADMRRAIGMALLYPLTVLLLAYGLLVAFVLKVVPKLFEAYAFFRLPAHRLSADLRDSLPYWVAVPPLVLLGAVIWWIQSGRVSALQPAWQRRSVGWFPWVRGILSNMRFACFSDILSMLVENQVPLPEAVMLAAESTADKLVISAAREIRSALDRGDSVSRTIQSAVVFPPMLRWLMAAGLEHGTLAKALRHAAETYRELALHSASLVMQLFPMVILLGVGATSALIYCIAVFEPFTALLDQLSGF